MTLLRRFPIPLYSFFIVFGYPPAITVHIRQITLSISITLLCCFSIPLYSFFIALRFSTMFCCFLHYYFLFLDQFCNSFALHYPKIVVYLSQTVLSFSKSQLRCFLIALDCFLIILRCALSNTVLLSLVKILRSQRADGTPAVWTRNRTAAYISLTIRTFDQCHTLSLPILEIDSRNLQPIESAGAA